MGAEETRPHFDPRLEGVGTPQLSSASRACACAREKVVGVRDEATRPHAHRDCDGGGGAPASRMREFRPSKLGVAADP